MERIGILTILNLFISGYINCLYLHIVYFLHWYTQLINHSLKKYYSDNFIVLTIAGSGLDAYSDPQTVSGETIFLVSGREEFQ